MRSPTRPAFRGLSLAFLVSSLLTPDWPAPAASFTVTTSADTPGGASLRSVLTQANAAPSEEHSIAFSSDLSGDTIALLSQLPAIALDAGRAVELDGTGSSGLRVTKSNPADPFPILRVMSGRATIIDLDIGSGDFEIDAGAQLSFRYSDAFEISDDIVGEGALRKEGAGRLTLSGSNSYQGGTSVLAGELQGDTDSLQGDFDVSADAGLIFHLAGTGGAPQTHTYAGVVSGQGRLVKSGDETLELTGANTHSGGTEIQEGILRASTSALSGAVAVGAGASFQLHQTADGDYAGDISGGGGVRKSGAAELTLSGVNSFGGGLAIEEGDVVGRATSIPGDVSLETASSRVIFDQSVAGTHAGDITGSGELIKRGTGTLTLTGPCSHTGGTQVEAGTLRGDTASLQGAIAVAGGGTLEFSHSSGQSFSGSLSGTGALVKSGSGRLSLGGDPSGFAGDTTVSAGVLQLDVALNNPGNDVLVGASGELVSTQSIGGNLVVDGAVSPGSSPTDVFAVGGTATFNAGSTLKVAVDAAGNASYVDVGGAATVGGGTLDVVAQAGHYTSVTYTVLRAGSLGGVGFQTTSPDYAFLDLGLQTTGTEAQLTIDVNANNVSDFASTPNQIATAAAFEELLGSGDADAAAVWESVQVLTEDEVPGMLDALAGETLSAFANPRLTNAQYFGQALARRFATARSSSEESRARAPRVDAGPGRSLSEPPRGQAGLGAWIEPFGVFGDLDGTGGASSMSSRVYGATAGLDYLLAGPGLRLGLGLGYSRVSLDSEGSLMTGSANIYQTALYAAYDAGLFHLGAAGRYAYSDMESRRSIAFGATRRTARGSFSGHEGSGLLEAGLHLGNPRVVAFHPLASLLYTHLTQESFDETGAGSLSLQVEAMEFDSAIAALGVRVSRMMTLKGDGFEPELRLGWTHEFGDRGRQVNALFDVSPPAGSFATTGARPDRDNFQVGGGFVFWSSSTPMASLHYDAHIGKNDTRHTLALAFYPRW